jgi:hypothetical protein
MYLTEDMIGPKTSWEVQAFDPVKRWGSHNVLPAVEASGRWANIPVCFPPTTNVMDSEAKSDTVAEYSNNNSDTNVEFVSEVKEKSKKKPHFLSACLWASAEFKPRGLKDFSNTDTVERLREWIEFHLMVGFDHIYIYDNSGAHTNQTSLEPVLQGYPSHQVTRIDWPSNVCNNNGPMHDSAGERSSQYAAEVSCRARYGPFSEWLASFDTDEYFVPMGNYTNLRDVISAVSKRGTNILSFRSSRGKLRFDASDEVMNGTAIQKSPDEPFLQAYNCDSAGSPKPKWADRAKKQIYRTDYVLHHFVHYSTVTKGVVTTYKESKEHGLDFHRQFREREPSEIVTDELTQAVMVHAKSISPGQTEDYKNRCRSDYKKKGKGCWVAYPVPNDGTGKEQHAHNDDGIEYNCHINTKVEHYWLPRLREALAKRQNSNKETTAS